MYDNVGLKHIFVVIRCLLINPNPESALNEEAGKLMLEDYDSYAKHARIFTEIHAPAPSSAPTDTENGQAVDGT